MHGEREFAKTNGSICNILIVAANICNFCQGLQFSNGLIVVKLKQDLQYRCYVYFEPVRQNVIYQALSYLKHTINSIRIIPFQKVTLTKN